GPYCSRRALTCSCVSPLLLASSRTSASSGAQAHSSGSGDGYGCGLTLLVLGGFGRFMRSIFMARRLALEFRSVPLSVHCQRAISRLDGSRSDVRVALGRR